MAGGSMPPHVHGQRPPPALRFRVTGATARPFAPRTPRPGPRAPTPRAKYRRRSTRPFRPQLRNAISSLFRERQAFRLHLQRNLQTVYN